MEMLPVAILAGGLATRMRPLTETVPKSMLQVAGEPFINHQLRLLAGQGIRRVILCIGYLGERIREHVGDGSAFGLQVEYSQDPPRHLLGTGGAILHALPLLGTAFFVLYGDSYLPCDFAAVQDAFWRSRKPALMTVFQNENRWDVSNVRFENGAIRTYDKTLQTPEMRHIDYGLGILTAEVLTTYSPPLDLADVYADLVHKGKLSGFEVSERFYEIGSMKGLKEAERIVTKS